MAKNKKKLRYLAQQTAQPHAIFDHQWQSGYDGVNASPRRGPIFFPTLDTRKELDTYSRQELVRRIRWLCINFGVLRGFIKNSAILVGWLTVQPRSRDRIWNKDAERRFKKWAGSKASFSVCGKYNFETAQLMLTRNKKRDGDVFVVLTTTPDRKSPMVAFYESHQLANPESGEGWIDGVKADGNGRHLYYGFRNEDGKVSVIPARAVIYYGDFESPGHHRAVPPLAHAVNHAIDVTEIRADTKHGIKAASLFGVAKESTAGQPLTKAARGMGGSLTEFNMPRPPSATGAGNAGSGGSPPVDRRVQAREVWGGGQFADLAPGEKLSVVHDGRPSPNAMAFQDELIRDMAIGFGLPPEVIVKMTNLNGPSVRFVMDVASRWFENEQACLWDPAERIYWYWLSFETLNGLGFPSDGDFMDVDWIPQRDLTIDRGKDGRQRMEELDRGLGTMGDWHKKMSGASADDKILERIEEVKFAREQCELAGVPYEVVFPPRAGAAPIQSEKSDPTEEGEPDPKDKS